MKNKKCKYLDLIPELLAPNINSVDKKIYKDHIKECDICKEEYQNLKDTIAIFEKDTNLYASEDLESRILENLNLNENTIPINNTNYWQYISSAAAMIAAIFIGISFFDQPVNKENSDKVFTIFTNDLNDNSNSDNILFKYLKDKNE